MPTQGYRTETIEEQDGARYHYEYMEPTEEALLGLLRDLFETHWSRIVFGPCIQGAVFEIRLTAPPQKVSMLDGYLTVDLGPWHFHLCLGEHRGTKANPTPEALARIRRASKAGFFRSLGRGCAGGSWGFRMWNGAGEQMLTVFFPNPYLNERMKPQKPDWSRLALWNEMRVKYLPGAVPWMPEEQEAAAPAGH
ncbi:DUF7676 family protein [Nitrospira sp. Kam-Ns4a]